MISILEDAYAPPNMRRAVDSAIERADAQRDRRRAIAREIERVETRYRRCAEREDAALERAADRFDELKRELAEEAQAGRGVPDTALPTEPDASASMLDDDLDVIHWREQRRAALRAREALRAEQRMLTTMLAATEADDDRARQLEALGVLAGRVGPLLTASRAVPGLTRSLIAALTNSITIAAVAPSFALIEVELRNGALVRRLLVTQSIWSTQPSRLWASTQLVRGASSITVEAELAASGAGRGAGRGDGEQVLTLALTHTYFREMLDVGPARDGAFESLDTLTGRIDIDPDQVKSQVLAGLCGPAEIVDGAFCVCPTEVELETAFPEYARRRVQERTGWVLDDTMLLTSAAARLRLSGSELERLTMGRGRGQGMTYVRDLSRRRYLQWSALPESIRRMALDNDTFDQAATFRDAVQRTVDAAGYAADSASDWHAYGVLANTLLRRGTLSSRVTFDRAARQGRILRIPYSGPPATPGARPPVVLVYCPAAVYASLDADAVAAWLRGDPSPQSPT